MRGKDKAWTPGTKRQGTLASLSIAVQQVGSSCLLRPSIHGRSGRGRSPSLLSKPRTRTGTATTTTATRANDSSVPVSPAFDHGGPESTRSQSLLATCRWSSAADVCVAVVVSLSRDCKSCSVAKRQASCRRMMLMRDCECAIQSSNDGASDEMFMQVGQDTIHIVVL